MALIKTAARDPAMMQTAAGYPSILEMHSSYRFTGVEVECLRMLASQVAEIAQRPQMQQKALLWTAHNDLKTDTPLVFIDPENGWNEILPADELLCEDPLARVWEMYLRKLIFWADNMRDDKVIEAAIDVPYVYGDNGWGVAVTKLGGEVNGSAYIVKQSIEDYERDFKKVHYPEIFIDMGLSERVLALAHSVFDGILEVRHRTVWWWSLGMTWDYINMRGMEDFLCDFLLEPEWVHRMMELLCEGTLRRLKWLETNGLLAPNTGAAYVGSGGFGFTEQLVSQQQHVLLKDMWGFVESQETSSVNPDLYGEFIYPYQKRIAEYFGLNCYGCCEAFQGRWKYVRELKNLRRVSVSPFSDWRCVPELLGKDYIASVKPSPSPLAVTTMDEQVVRADCRRAVEQTYGGICEFIMKDNHTLGGNPGNAIRWVEIMREEIDRRYSTDAHSN